MKGLKVSGIISAIVLAGISPVCAQMSTESSGSPAKTVELLRDSTYEQYLHFQASPDTAITPARVLRWMNSLMGHTSVASSSNLEFQPVLRVNDTQKQIVGQFAYKF